MKDRATISFNVSIFNSSKEIETNLPSVSSYTVNFNGEKTIQFVIYVPNKQKEK
jgi:hypothetical protein